MTRTRLKALPALAVIALVGLGAAALDPAGAQDVIANRQEAMKGNGKAMKALKQMIEAGTADPAEAAKAARAIHQTSQRIPELFPEGSGMGDTDALPAIWQDWEKFRAAAGKLEEESAELIRVAGTGDVNALAAQFKAVGGACGDCHKPFRKKKK